MYYDYEIKNDKLLREAYQNNSYNQLDESSVWDGVKTVGGYVGKGARGIGRGLYRLSPWFTPLEFLPGGLVYDGTQGAYDFMKPATDGTDYREMAPDPRYYVNPNQPIDSGGGQFSPIG